MNQKNKFSCTVTLYGLDENVESWVDVSWAKTGGSSPLAAESSLSAIFDCETKPVFCIGKHGLSANSPDDLERQLVEFARNVFAAGEVSCMDECDAGRVTIPFGFGVSEQASDCVVKIEGLSSYSSGPQTLVPDVTTEQVRKIADVLHKFPASCLPDCIYFDNFGGIDQYFSIKDHREESPDRTSTDALIAEVAPLVNELLFNTVPELNDEDEEDPSGGISFFPKAFMAAISHPGATIEVRRSFEIKVSCGDEYVTLATEEASADALASKFSHIFSHNNQTNKGPKF
jgi:hypothetical protein